MSVKSVKATINGQNYNLTFNSSTGKWEAVIIAPSGTSWNQEDHKYGVTITAEDQAGNKTTKDRTDSSFGDKLKIRVLEKTAPSVSLVKPSSGSRLNSSVTNIEFNITDLESGVDKNSIVVKIDNTPLNNSNITFKSVSNGYNCNISSGVLNEGIHNINISVKDNDDNLSNLISSNFYIDTIPPVLNISNVADGLITNDSSLTIIGTTNDNTSSPTTVNVKINGSDKGNATLTDSTFNKTVTLSEGVNNIEVSAIDAAGLKTSVNRTVTLDTHAPTFTDITITPNPVDCGKTLIINVVVND